MEDRLDLVEIKILYAMLNLASSNNDYQEMKNRYDALAMADKQRLLDEFNRRLKRTMRTGPAELFSTLPPPRPQPPGAGASAAASTSAYTVPEAPERVEPQIPAGPTSPSLEDTYEALSPDLSRAPARTFLSSPRPDLVCHPRLPLRKCP